jgi:hypothetical protein
MTNPPRNYKPVTGTGDAPKRTIQCVGLRSRVRKKTSPAVRICSRGSSTP